MAATVSNTGLIVLMKLTRHVHVSQCWVHAEQHMLNQQALQWIGLMHRMAITDTT